MLNFPNCPFCFDDPVLESVWANWKKIIILLGDLLQIHLTFQNGSLNTGCRTAKPFNQQLQIIDLDKLSSEFCKPHKDCNLYPLEISRVVLRILGFYWKGFVRRREGHNRGHVLLISDEEQENSLWTKCTFQLFVNNFTLENDSNKVRKILTSIRIWSTISDVIQHFDIFGHSKNLLPH